MAKVIKNLKIQNFELRTLQGKQLCVQCPGLWIRSKDRGDLVFSYNPSCFSHVNDHFHGLVSMRIPRFVHEKQEGL